jgi:hypothetical protein
MWMFLANLAQTHTFRTTTRTLAAHSGPHLEGAHAKAAEDGNAAVWGAHVADTDSDPKEGTVRRILALVGGRGDKTALLSRLHTTPWTRKKVVMTKLTPTKGGVDEVAEGLSNLERLPLASSEGGNDRSQGKSLPLLHSNNNE